MSTAVVGTSAEVATYAAKILRSDEYPKIIKAVAAAARCVVQGQEEGTHR